MNNSLANLKSNMFSAELARYYTDNNNNNNNNNNIEEIEA